MKTARKRPTPVELEVGLEARDLPPERVPAGDDVEHAQVLAVEHDQAGARAEHRLAGPHQVAQRLDEALALEPERDRGRLAARDDQPVDLLEVGGGAHLARLCAEVAQHPCVRLEVAL